MDGIWSPVARSQADRRRKERKEAKNSVANPCSISWPRRFLSLTRSQSPSCWRAFPNQVTCSRFLSVRLRVGLLVGPLRLPLCDSKFGSLKCYMKFGLYTFRRFPPLPLLIYSTSFFFFCFPFFIIVISCTFTCFCPTLALPLPPFSGVFSVSDAFSLIVGRFVRSSVTHKLNF